MTITVNGEPMSLEADSTVRDLLGRLGRSDAPCAVEVNAAIVPHREHERHRLVPGDRVEIVTLVGGG